jgi:hypothetical protein
MAWSQFFVDIWTQLWGGGEKMSYTSLREAYVDARIVETCDNYARADAPLLEQTERQGSNGDDLHYDDDETFWQDKLANPDRGWDADVFFHYAVLSEWVARVPGLYWKPESAKLRQLSPAAIEHESDRWITYKPSGKSQKVMGGIGTFRLPSANDGTRLVTLTTTGNASAGVPALIFPDVWDKIRKFRSPEGRLLSYGKARWQAMAQGWAERFQSTRDIPRGYLVLDDPDAIQIDEFQFSNPVQIHPFTVMEYYTGSKELFDYVYATADTGDPNYRSYLETFFGQYRNELNRYGRYLLAGDMVNSLWDAEYDSPEALRRSDPSAVPQLNLLEARVRESLQGKDTIADLLEVMGRTCADGEDVKTLSKEVGIPPTIWFRGGTVAEICSQFLDAILHRNKLPEFVEVFALRYSSVTNLLMG